MPEQGVEGLREGGLTGWQTTFSPVRSFVRSSDQSELRDQFLREEEREAQRDGQNNGILLCRPPLLCLSSFVAGDHGEGASEDKRRRQLETDQLRDRRGRRPTDRPTDLPVLPPPPPSYLCCLSVSVSVSVVVVVVVVSAFVATFNLVPLFPLCGFQR